MKRKLTLYIGEHQADLTSDSIIQINYTADDLMSPAVVKNSYSQQITLPSTRNNDAIFGAIFRADRHAKLGAGYTGSEFNPLVRTPFAIYDEQSSLVESGYMKLDNITTKGRDVQYKISLYGGLGSFFYQLTNDENDEEITLGALPLFNGKDTEPFKFQINREAVRDAWRSLRSNADDLWQTINFAPAYNGLPDGEFSADKGVGRTEVVGGDPIHREDGKDYIPYDGYSLYDLGEEFTEWQTKDLRSYLQRPVASVRALIDGIARYAKAHGGFILELDESFFNEGNPYYVRAWMTLPLLSTYERDEESGAFEVNGDEISHDVSGGLFSEGIALKLLPGEWESERVYTVTIKPDISIYSPSIDTEKTTYLAATHKSSDGFIAGTGTVVFAQLQICDNGNTTIASSPIQVYLSSDYKESMTGIDWVNQNYNSRSDSAPLTGAVLESGAEKVICGKLTGELNRLGSKWSIHPETIKEMTAYAGVNASYAIVRVWVRDLFVNSVRHLNGKYYTYMFLRANNNINLARLADDGFPISLNTNAYGIQVVAGKVEYKVPGQYRSNSKITQEILFANTMTPAAFLLSYTKTMGLSYLYDKGTKTVRIVSRDTLYDGETIDLEQRIDRSREIKTQPLVITSKWLSFSVGEVEGQYAAEYRRKYGREYGAQRINTGYDFNADTKEVLDGVFFKGGAEVQEKDLYFNNVTLNGSIKKTPSPFLNGKASYRLYGWGNPEDSMDFEGLTPDATADVVPYIEDLPSYDAVPKLQCREEENDPTDGAGILLFHRGTIDSATANGAYKRFIITDDSAVMYTLNDKKPCWEFTDGLPVTDMPVFGRHWLKAGIIDRTMDFALPAEIDIPLAQFNKEAGVYRRAWQRFIEDRYNVDSRVCTAYVRLDGLQVDERLLRKFYFFDNALWVLNKIINYSLTSPDTTQCEFVKVQDTEAYDNGQVGMSELIAQVIVINDTSVADMPARNAILMTSDRQYKGDFPAGTVFKQGMNVFPAEMIAGMLGVPHLSDFAGDTLAIHSTGVYSGYTRIPDKGEIVVTLE